MKDFLREIERCIECVKHAAYYVDKPEVEEFLAECGYDMDLERELIVLQYLEERFKD